MTVDIGTAFLLIAGYAGLTLISELIKMFMQRMRSADYVTKKDCEKCSQKGIKAEQSLERKLDAITKLVVALAYAMKVDVKEIQQLVGNGNGNG